MESYLGALGGIAQAMSALAPALGMLAVFALIFGGVRLLIKRRDRQKAVLMLVLAAVILGNVVVGTM
ncbi:MAG: hypothetical protein V4472_00405 [Pseudomonadota bacterium]